MLGIVEMRAITFIFLAFLLPGCVRPPASDFVQGTIRIIPPVEKAPGRAPGVLEDGGTTVFTMRDATGNTFDVYIDHHLGTKTPGAIYLFARPTEGGSVRVENEADFKKIVRLE